MPIIGESLENSEPSHDDKRNLVDNAGLTSLAAIVRFPSQSDVFLAGNNYFLAKFENLSQLIHPTAIGTACGRVATFQQDETRRNKLVACLTELAERLICFGMPLISHIP